MPAERVDEINAAPLRTERLSDVCARLHSSRQHIYNLMADKSFPKPRRVGRKALWLTHEVDAWFMRQPAEIEAPRAASKSPAKAAAKAA